MNKIYRLRINFAKEVIRILIDHFIDDKNLSRKMSSELNQQYVLDNIAPQSIRGLKILSFRNDPKFGN